MPRAKHSALPAIFDHREDGATVAPLCSADVSPVLAADDADRPHGVLGEIVLEFQPRSRTWEKLCLPALSVQAHNQAHAPKEYPAPPSEEFTQAARFETARNPNPVAIQF